METTTVAQRPYSRAEELTHWISHATGCVGMIVGLPFLVLAANGPAAVVGASIFAATGILLYLASAVYHSLPEGRAKEVCEILDHSAIYLLIAGTYTPITLGVLRGPWGWTLFGLVWGIATLGVTLKGVFGVRHPKISVALYLAMGWLVVIAIKPLLEKMPTPGLLWLAAGGLAYTLGVTFYVIKRVRYFHFVWHLFVLVGTTCHYFAVLWYAM